MFNTKPYIFYHSHCADGILATAIMMNYFAQNKHYIEPQVIPYNHGDEINVKELRLAKSYNKGGKRVFIEVFFLDILPETVYLKPVVETGCKVIILDHHKSAISTIKELVEETREITLRTVDTETGKQGPIITSLVNKYPNIHNFFDMKLSGCGLAWKWVWNQSFSHGIFIPGSSSPGFSPRLHPLVEFVQDGDIWTHHYQESNWVRSYLATYKKAIDYNVYIEELHKWDPWNSKETFIVNSVHDGIPPLVVNKHGLACIKEGKRIYELYEAECLKITETYAVKRIDHPEGSFLVAITECSGKYASAVGNTLADLPGVDFSVTYEMVTNKNGGNTNCRGILMDLKSKDPFVYLRARGNERVNLDLSKIITFWDAPGSTGGGHMKASGSTSNLERFLGSFRPPRN